MGSVDTMLQQDLQEYFDAAFCEQSKQMGFNNLAEVLCVTAEDLIRREGFSYQWLAELSSFLSSKGILYLLQPIPGNRPA